MRVHADRGILVGREPQLAELEHRLAEGSGGQGSLLLISGEPGIGKTRILGATLRAASSFRYRAVAATNLEHARAPFGPWIDVLRELISVLPDLDVWAESDRPVLERFLGVSPTAAPLPDKRRVFVIIAHALERAAARVPIAIGFDDAQWFDPESIELLHFLVPRLASSRVVLAVATRTGDEHGAHVIPSLQRFPSCVTVAISPLDNAAVREMIAAAMPSGRRLRRKVVDAISERAGGNPLFVSELVREALRDEHSQSLPPSIQIMISHRLARLEAAQERIVEAASVLGSTFSTSALMEITQSSLADVVAALRASRDIGIVDESHDPDTFTFRHELVRLAVYNRMLGAEARSLHRAMAERLELFTEGSAPALLAYHWRQAGETARSARYSEAAGDEAMRLHAYSSACARYEEAVDDGVVRDAELGHLQAKLARAHDLVGDSATAMEHFRRSADLFHSADRPDNALNAELAFARAAHRAGRSDEMVAACIGVLDRTHDSQHSFAAHSLLAMFHVYRQSLEAGQVHIDAADAITGTRDVRDELSLEWARALASLYRNEEKWVRLAEGAVSIAERHADPALLAYTLLNFSAMARERGRDREALEATRRAIDISDQNGLSFASAYLRCQLVETLNAEGRLREAHRVLLEAVGLHVDAAIARLYCASAGLTLLADMDLVDTLPFLSDLDLVEAAFATGEDNRFAPITAAHVHAAAMRGEGSDASGLIDRALSGTKSFAYTSGSLLIFARYGSSRDLDRIEAIMGDNVPAAGHPRLHFIMIRALLALRRKSQTVGRHHAAVGLDLAERLQARMHAAFLLELLGRKADALAIYRACAADAHVRRLDASTARSLTKREQQIAELVAQGYPNRTIADRLSVSERTIEHHTASIYAKTGCRSRSEFIASYTKPSLAATR
jgi:DNA-binding CsgD family transcriptional regulator